MAELAKNAMQTVENLKIMLSIPDDDNSYDDFLTLLINYASSWIESITGRRFGLNEYVQQLAGSGQQELVLRQYPIRIVAGIKDKDSGQVIPPQYYSYAEDGEIGVIYRDEGWAARAFPTGLVPDYIRTRRYLEVSYTAGFVLPKDFAADTPEDWKLPASLQGIVSQIASQELALHENGAEGLSAFSISDVSWTFDKAPRESWINILNTFQRVV